jgi:hypothetical protein
VGYPKGSINRLLQDDYARLRPKPQPLTPAWQEWLEAFHRRYPSEVSRMRGESLEQRALQVLRFSIPGWD